MAFLSRLGAWVRRLFGAPRSTVTAAPPAGRRLADLLTSGPSIVVVSASIADHVAVVTVRDPLPSSLDAAAEDALVEEARRALREHPAEGPIKAMEVWAPREPGAAPVLASRREFAGPLTVSAAPSPEVLRAHRERHVPHVLTPDEDTPPAAAPAPGVGPGPVEPRDERLRPLGRFLVVPPRLAERLGARGVDPSAPALVPLVEGLLAEAGYEVRRGEQHGGAVDLEASSGAGRAVVRCYPSEGRVAAASVDRFAFAFLSAHADEGFFVTDGLLPFAARHWERDPRIHLLDRVGLQRLVDAVAAASPRPTV